jgi:iron complex outermembrane receptor protein
LPGAPGTLATIIENAATATGDGVELELAAALTDSFLITASAAWLDTEYGDWTTINTNSPTPTIPVNVAGNTLMLAPKFTSFIAPQYTRQLGDFANLVLRGEWRYQSKVWFSQFSMDINSQDAYNIFNAQVSLVDRDGHWNVTAYGTNIGDERVLNFSQSNASGDALVWAAPEEFGIKVGYRF